MDPNANLARQREIAAEVMRLWDAATPDGEVDSDALAHLAFELAEHVEALNEWIMRGGYLPADWTR